MLPDRIDDEQVPLLDDPPPPPLAVAKDDGIEGAPVVVLAGDGVAEGDDYGRALSQDAARKLGVTSTMLLILNKMVSACAGYIYTYFRAPSRQILGNLSPLWMARKREGALPCIFP